MCYQKHISIERIAMGEKDPLQFPYTAKSYGLFRKGLRALFSGGGFLQRIGELF
jgi:succinate-semialdehyde dehydrogenase/glutarate-semialdehyde dehydrogenase